VLQRVAACCSVLPCVADGGMEGTRGGETVKAGGGSCFAVCCRLSLCCRVFQCVAGGGVWGLKVGHVLQRVTACCSVLQVSVLQLTLKLTHHCYSSCVSLFAFFFMCVRVRVRVCVRVRVRLLEGATLLLTMLTHMYIYICIYTHIYVALAVDRVAAFCNVLAVEGVAFVSACMQAEMRAEHENMYATHCRKLQPLWF